MGSRDMPLPECYELLLGKERDRWPPEARLICAAHNGNVREIKSKTDPQQPHHAPLSAPRSP